MKNAPWTDSQISQLKNLYPDNHLTVISEIMQVPVHTIKNKARIYNITKGQQKFSKLKPLYENSLESWYWKGFIMADGHISNVGTLLISCHCQDENHLNKLASLIGKNVIKRFINTSYKNGIYCFLNCHDSVYGPKINEQMGVVVPKTYNSPNLSLIRDDTSFIAFLIGLIDGDGCFPTDKSRPNISKMRMIMHRNWYPALVYIQDRMTALGFLGIKVKITNQNNALLVIYRQENLKRLKNFIHENNIPHLERKWNKITY